MQLLGTGVFLRLAPLVTVQKCIPTRSAPRLGDRHEPYLNYCCYTVVPIVKALFDFEYALMGYRSIHTATIIKRTLRTAFNNTSSAESLYGLCSTGSTCDRGVFDRGLSFASGIWNCRSSPPPRNASVGKTHRLYLCTFEKMTNISHPVVVVHGKRLCFRVQFSASLFDGLVCSLESCVHSCLNRVLWRCYLGRSSHTTTTTAEQKQKAS